MWLTRAGRGPETLLLGTACTRSTILRADFGLCAFAGALTSAAAPALAGAFKLGRPGRMPPGQTVATTRLPATISTVA